MIEGIVVSKRYGLYTVLSEGVFYNTSIKGILKFKNQLYVGDKVSLAEGNFVIDEVYPRYSLIKRPPVSNVDQILLVFSLKEPEFSYFLACKYLTYANYNGIKASLVLTKADKANEKEIEEIKKTFNQIGVDVYLTSSVTGSGVNDIKSLFENKITVLIGQSGVGKSSLINAIDENFNRDIGEYSFALGRGKHQTKEVILLPYQKGFIADTPGFSSLELDLNKNELAKYFPSFYKYNECYFSDCIHVSEKDCAIKKQVEEGIIPSKVYECYLKLLEEVEKY